MTRYQLFRLLRRNQRIGMRRSPAFDQGLLAKVLTFFGGAVMLLYMIGIGLALGMAASSDDGDVGMLLLVMPFVLVFDFLFRFLAQQTPAMLVKPYVLLPISRYAVIDMFLVSSLLSGYNALWLGLLLPYAVITLAGGAPLGTVLLVTFTGLVLILLNSQFYLLMRTLINRHLWWWLPALGCLSLLFLPYLLTDIDSALEGYVNMGHTPWPLLAALLLTAVLLVVNRRLQYRFVYEEIARTGDKSISHVSRLSFLDRFGQTGEYLKLEAKSVMRNKVMRTRFWSSLTLIIVFCLLIAYTPVYDGMVNFWCFYCFGLYGVTSLVKIMCPEGNYIDLLMSHRENILSLLHAKYYFHCAILLVPLVVMLPAVIEGKFTLLMMFSYMALCAGPVYCILFQLAVYNSQTLPLQQKITGKGNFENGRQLIIESIAFLLPGVLVVVLHLFFEATVAYLVQMVFGLCFVVTYPWWLRNVYSRMMHRRYVLLEGFHSTR